MKQQVQVARHLPVPRMNEVAWQWEEQLAEEAARKARRARRRAANALREAEEWENRNG